MGVIKILENIFVPPRPFSSIEIEQEFIYEYSRKFLAHRRTAIIIGFCTWIAYMGWDFFHAYMNPEFAKVSQQIYTLRILGIMILGILTRLMYSQLGAEENKAVIILGSAVCVCYMLILMMIHIMPFPYGYLYYYIGLLLVLLFMFGFLRLRANIVLMLSYFLISISGIVFFLDRDVKFSEAEKIQSIVNGYYWSAAMCYLISFMMIGCAVSVEIERTARQSFLREKDLKDSNKETENRTTAILLLKEEKAKLMEKNIFNKSKYFADVAHDLNNSMHSIGLLFYPSLNAIKQGNLQHAEESLENLGLAVRNMSTTLNAILDISKLESGTYKSDITSFDIYCLAENIINSLKPIAHNNNVTLRLTKRRNQKSFVRSDNVLLGRVLTNLISNAIKYADYNKKRQVVMVGIVCLPQYIRIETIDNGIGIPSTKIRNIFKPFFQIDESADGLGLGLSIVNVIISLLEEHRIEVSSREKLWTRFSIEVPLADEDFVNGNNIAMNYENKINSLEGTYVLFVEDNVLTRKATSQLLIDNGALCEAFESLDHLLEAVPKLERDPDIVLCDYRLSNDFTASDVLDVMRRHFGYEIPFLVMTGEVKEASEDKALDGIKILRKPMDSNEIISHINQSLLKSLSDVV